jgi:hypothetical protein
MKSNLDAKNVAAKDVPFSKNRLSKFYRSIVGITGHPVKNQKNAIYLSLGCWMQKSVCEYLVSSSNGSGKTTRV